MKGFTLIESMIGIGLMLIIFLSIFGVYQLSFQVVGNSRARITAIALANQKIEFIRNLSYDDVGTIDGIPPGIIPETEIITRNGIDYTVKTTIIYIDDSFDGVAPSDSLPNDYKRIKIKSSWQKPFVGETILVTDVSPKGLETSVGGGNLLIKVFDASGIGVPQADIHIVNSVTVPPIDVHYQTNNEGKYLVAGAPASTESYQITVSKSGYSQERTYGTDEIVNPKKTNITVIEGDLTQTSFSIDVLGGFSIDTFSPFGAGSFSDSFLNDDKVSEFSGAFIGGGEVVLAEAVATPEVEYESSGYLISNVIVPLNLKKWNEFSWNDNEPSFTDIDYQIFYATSTDWFLVPDGDLFGNSNGFDISPVDLTNLSVNLYPKLKLRGNLSTEIATTTPTLYNWQLSWQTDESTSIANVEFHLQGAKVLGTDINENPVYKYSQDHTSGSNSHINIFDLEWDSYVFSVDSVAIGLNLINTDPFPQPINLSPDIVRPVKLFLSAENSLLAQVKNNETAESIFSASIRIFNSELTYDETQFSDEKGEAIFIPIDFGSYNFEVRASGYQNASGSVSVNGDTVKIIYLEPGEI